MARIFSSYLKKAKEILEDNWTGRSTIPAPGMYPHQWSWDSGFIAIGKSRYDMDEAITEIETLFSAQWANGMLPQIVFDPENLGHYFPEPDFWLTEKSPFAPEGPLTSGITMPPIHAVAALAIHRNSHGKAVDFLRRIYPALDLYHDYLHSIRDPLDEGLAYIRHPWESGIDNSPMWDPPLGTIVIDRKKLPPYERKDLDFDATEDNRPSDDDYDRYVYLVDLFRRHNYDEETIRDECPFLVQDPLFNSILCRADESLAEIAGIIGEPPQRSSARAAKTRLAIRKKLWNPSRGTFDAFDLVSGHLIEADTSSGFMPLFAGAASVEQAELLYNRLNSKSFCSLHQGNCFTLPNYDTQKKNFDRSNYWRGPVWININWMLSKGLRRYGYTLKADSLQKDLLQLPIRFGFREYFDSFDGTPYGSDSFSWTAALFIDLVHEFYARSRSNRPTIFTTTTILNEGSEPSPVLKASLAPELMRCIRELTKKFYDTRRGLVDYTSLKDSDEFRMYRTLTNGLRDFDPAGLAGRRQKIAFWINIYNSIVIDAIATLGIKSSVREIPGFFRKIKYRIGGTDFSADDMEHGILRCNARRIHYPFRQFGPGDQRRLLASPPVDPRIHFALVCGSRSCAPIDFYSAENIYDQLELAATSFVNSSEVIVLPEENKIMISEIFRWYREDFGGIHGIMDFVYDFLKDERAKDFIKNATKNTNIEFLYYDWNLNR